MSVISQSLPNLLNGVSQRAPRLRHSSQAEEQVNALSDPVKGLTKRPPTEHRAKLPSSTLGNNLLVRTVDRDADHRYLLVAGEGDLRLYRPDTGEEIGVLFPDGKGYLEGQNIQAVPAGDTVFIINPSVVVQAGGKAAPTPEPEALLYVRQADYATRYTVILEGIEVEYRSPYGQSPQSRDEIDTEQIARGIMEALLARGGPFQNFIFRRMGSTIHIKHREGRDFSLSVSDGLADMGLVAIKGRVQAAEDLPRKAPDGFTVEVTGMPGEDADNYWVRFTDRGGPENEGVWEECPKPGTLVSLDASTMPHILQYRGALLGPVKGEGPPPTPTLQDSRWHTEKAGWTEGSSGNHDESVDAILTWHGDYYRAEVPGADGTEKTISIAYAFDGSAMILGTQARAIFSFRNGTTGDWEVLTSRGFVAGKVRANLQETFKLSPLPGSQIEVRLEYGLGKTPTDPSGEPDFSRVGRLAVWGLGSTRDDAGLVVKVPKGVQVTFDTDAYFPSGTEVTITVDGTPFTYTVPDDADHTGAVVLSALRDAINAHPGLVADLHLESGMVEIYQEGEVEQPSVSVSVGFTQETAFYSPDLGISPGDHVGRIVRNRTDGSEGIIVSTTATTIRVASLSGGGRNTFAPGDEIEVVNPGDYYVFRAGAWKDRESSPEGFPSFVGKRIQGGFVYQGRLGLLAGTSVVLSASGDYFRFFRKTASSILDDDPIDVEHAGQDVAVFHAATEWDEGLYLWSDKGPYLLGGVPILTPSTVSITPAGKYPNDPRVSPVVLGDRVFFVRSRVAGVEVMEAVVGQNERVYAVDITEEVPTYIQGSPVRLAGDGNLGMLLVLTSRRDRLYCYRYRDSANGRVLSSWSRWEFPSGGAIVGLDMHDGEIYLVVRYSDGTYLERIHLNWQVDLKSRHLDRLCIPTSTYQNGITTWNLPYQAPSGLVVVDRDTGEILAEGNQAQGDLRDRFVFAGVPYTFRYEFSPIYFRDPSGEPILQGRLTVHYIDLWYHDTTDAALEVTPQGRSSYTVETHTRKPNSGRLRAPVHSREARIVLKDSSPGACAVSSLDWEGFYTRRSRRM